MKRILVSVTNDLVNDQRVHKVCTTLTQANYDVLLIGRKLKTSKGLKRNYKTFRFQLLFKKGFLFYAEYNLRLFFKILFLKKDILLSNDLDTLLPNYLVSRILKKKLVYDSHELFTEVPELIDRPFTQKIWLKIEQFIVPKLNDCYTVSDSIATYYNNKYKTNFQVVKNLPYKIAKKKKGSFPFETKSKKIILYQGALNKGRGIELMLEVMQLMINTIFVIIGTGDIEKELKLKVKNLKLTDSIKFIPKVNPNELQKLTPLANLGISLEEDLGLNYNYCLPNKLFDYIQANIPVLVSDLPEMKKVVTKYNVGEIVESRKPKELANQITNLLNKKAAYYKQQLDKASSELIWESESKKLVNIFNKL